MAFSNSIEQFNGLTVVDFEGENNWQGPGVAYRLREEYEDEVSIKDRLDALLQCDGVDKLTTLIIGAWSGACEGGSSEGLIADLVAAAPRLPALQALFIGEMTFEECEISWIVQSDLSPVLSAFPKLQTLRIRGGSELSFSRVQNSGLRELAIEAGGIDRSVLRQIFLCDFPNLEHLELMLGDGGYGFDGSPEDLQPVLSGRLYPNLKFLGLMNSEIVNDIAPVVVNSPVVERIKVLDLSGGNLDNTGIASLHALSEHANLERLNISHHYCSELAVRELKAALSCEVDASDPQEADDEWRPILHAE